MHKLKKQKLNKGISNCPGFLNTQKPFSIVMMELRVLPDRQPGTSTSEFAPIMLHARVVRCFVFQY